MVPPRESECEGWRPSIVVHPPRDCEVVRGSQVSSTREQARGVSEVGGSRTSWYTPMQLRARGDVGSVAGVAWSRGPAPSRATGKGALL
jgi:hypothetical protein